MRITRHINKVLDKTLGIEIRKSRTSATHKAATDTLGFDFEPFLTAVGDAYKKSPSPYSFLKDQPDPLKITLSGTPVKKVRIQLTSTGYLNLHSISLFDKNNKRLSLKGAAKVEASSYFGTSYDRKNAFVDSQNNQPFTIHTILEHCPWVTVSLPKPVVLGSITLNNRHGQYAVRAAGLTVSVSPDGTEWKKSYPVVKPSDIKKCRSLARQYGAESLKKYETISDFSAHLALGDHKPALQFFKQVSPAYKKDLQKAVNRIILRDRQLEWTSHGPYRSFRFWSKAEKTRYIRTSMDIVNDLAPLSADVCLGFGSVLAVVRDKDLIPHDDDLDIIIAFHPKQAPTITKALQLIRRHLEPKGYEMTGSHFNHYQVVRSGFKKVDVFVGIYEKDGTIGWFPGTRGALDRKDVFPASTSSLLGVHCTIPRDAKKYLSVVYGKDWRSPKPGWSHAWNSTSYKDIA